MNEDLRMNHCAEHDNSALSVTVSTSLDLGSDPNHVYMSFIISYSGCIVHTEVKAVPFDQNVSECYIIAEFKAMAVKDARHVLGSRISSPIIYTQNRWTEDIPTTDIVRYEVSRLRSWNEEHRFEYGYTTGKNSVTTRYMQEADFMVQRDILNGK